MRQSFVLCLAVLLALTVSAFAKPPVLDDEFVGPFASWVNVKTDCGAKGDGLTDDTAAIQAGLDLVNPTEAKRKVLYFPAGTYRITKTLNVPRPTHWDTIGMGIVGEDPATTTITWDGAADGRMFYFCGWYCRMMRLTLDGKGKAKDAIFHGLPFATALGYTDMVFKDVQFGIEAGERDGIAECLVLRCKFIRCTKAGISIQNFNTLDWWIWYSTFEDCHIGVSSEYNKGGGHFHVYESLFKNSTEADMTIWHTSFFGIRHNTSINSKAFFIAKRPDNWTDKENYGAEINFQGNRIYDPLDDTPIRIANAGTVLLLDNVIRSRGSVKAGPIVRQVTPAGDASLLSFGNTFTAPNPLQVVGSSSAYGDRVVSRKRISTVLPVLPGTAPNRHRRIFEIPAGAKGEVIQQAIDDAAKLAGQRPVIHLPKGEYPIGNTLVIPPGTDMMLIGDGMMTVTNLNWTGPVGKPMVDVRGPSHALFRELYFNGANTAVGIRAQGCDQPAGRVNMQEVWMDSGKPAVPAEMLVNGLDYTDVSTMGSGFGKITAIGGPLAAQGKRPRTQVVCYGMGAGCLDTYELQNGGSILQRDGWYEGPYRTYLRLTGKGTFTMDGGEIAVGNYQNKVMFPEEEGKPAIEIDNFQGKITFIRTSVLSVDPTRAPNIEIKGTRSDLQVLFLGGSFQPDILHNTAPNARVAVVACRRGVKELGTASIPNHGVVDVIFLTEMLAQTRSARLLLFTPLKLDTTDLRLDRVFFRSSARPIELLAGTVAPR
jgi:hypothetical protein